MKTPTKLWIRYTQHQDLRAREDLILHYTPLVKGIVNSLNLSLPSSLEQDDLVSYGVIGLITAVDRFDLSQQVKFETYALPRIRGQIIDSLRTLDLLPRSIYRRNREMQAAITELCQTNGRTPTKAEVAEHLQISLQEYDRWLTDAACKVISLSQPVGFSDDENVTLYDTLHDEDALTPAEKVDDDELKRQLIAAIETLSERDQLLISLYYNDELTMKEIGQLMDVSESRVSQIHAKIMLALHSFIQQSIAPTTAALH